MLTSVLVFMHLHLAYGSGIVSFQYSAICGRGNKNNTTPYQETVSRSLSHCLMLCSKDERCTRVNHDKKRMCGLFDDIIRDCSTDGMVSSRDVTFYQQREELCKNGGVLVSGVCKCVPCWAGERCGRLPADCTEAFAYAHDMYHTNDTHVCNLRPRNTKKVFQARCLFNDEGWTFIQLRKNCIGVHFNRKWTAYKRGFGSDDCLWLGKAILLFTVLLCMDSHLHIVE